MRISGIQLHSSVSSPAALCAPAISGSVPAGAELPGIKVSVELDINGGGYQARKPPAFSKALESESRCFSSYGEQAPH